MEISTKTEIICIPSAIIIAILIAIIVLAYPNSINPREDEYSVMFKESDITFQHDETGVTFVIDKIDQVGTKSMSISDLVDNPVGNDYSIFATMFSNGGQLIDLDFRFDNQPLLAFQTSLGQPTLIEISVNKQFGLGKYHGWFILPGPNGFSIPITLSTPPLIAQSMMIIIIGALTSIIVIEIARLADYRIQNKLKLNATIIADPIFASKVDRKIKVFEDRYSGITAIIKQASLSFLPALFALALALFAFINNELVTKVLELNFQNVVALFLLGAGIESLKELFNQS
jgi:hypothetical protein